VIPGIGWTEILVICAIAIIVVGPQDLPRLMRTVGYWVGKARGMAREFQRSFEEMAREAEFEEMRKEADKMREATRLPRLNETVTPLRPDEERTMMERVNRPVIGGAPVSSPPEIDLAEDFGSEGTLPPGGPRETTAPAEAVSAPAPLRTVST
jgi:sec-independent protein translocase protein TatB